MVYFGAWTTLDVSVGVSLHIKPPFFRGIKRRFRLDLWKQRRSPFRSNMCYLYQQPSGLDPSFCLARLVADPFCWFYVLHLGVNAATGVVFFSPFFVSVVHCRHRPRGAR